MNNKTTKTQPQKNKQVSQLQKLKLEQLNCIAAGDLNRFEDLTIADADSETFSRQVQQLDKGNDEQTTDQNQPINKISVKENYTITVTDTGTT